ncbi:MAG: chalcone isomerase family protein [Variovorax sp.]
MWAGVSGLAGSPAIAHAALQPGPELKAALPDVQRAGESRLTVWGFAVYDASLWVTPGFRAAEWSARPLALELMYLRDFDGESIAKRSLEEMRRSGPIGPEQAALWLRTMNQAFPDVKKGDRLIGIYEPGTGVRFLHNGRTTANVRDAQFAQRFFAIWLGPQTSEPVLRDALLGGAR